MRPVQNGRRPGHRQTRVWISRTWLLPPTKGQPQRCHPQCLKLTNYQRGPWPRLLTAAIPTLGKTAVSFCQPEEQLSWGIRTQSHRRMKTILRQPLIPKHFNAWDNLKNAPTDAVAAKGIESILKKRGHSSTVLQTQIHSNLRCSAEIPIWR